MLTERQQTLATRPGAATAEPGIEPAAPSAAPLAPTPSRVRAAISAVQQRLLGLQRDDGHWCAEFEGDSILESEYVLCLYFLGFAGDPRLERAAEHLRRVALADGGWAIYPGGPAEVSASVKAYLVLKLLGDDPSAPHMESARQRILELGGIDACNSFTKLYLAIFRQYDWRDCPVVPPEIVLLPRWFYFDLYAMSAWTRGIVVPLSLIWAHRPSCPLPESASIGELRLPRERRRAIAEKTTGSRRSRLWNVFFRTVSRVGHGLERLGIRPLRRRALAAAEAWIVDHLHKSDGVAAIFPPIINTLIGLRCQGYEIDHPLIQSQLHELEKLELDKGNGVLQIQPCFSPVWDTALSLDALRRSGLPANHPALLDAARWLLDHEVGEPGDLQRIDPTMPIGGWYFEYANELYPDCDDTAEVLQALSGVRFDEDDEAEALSAAIARGRTWLEAMQNRDGGWAAFDRGCDKKALTYIPFADHNAMIDPSTTDVTARTLEALLANGVDRQAPALRRAVAFLRDEQETDGTWYGRWGCNYLYGTWLALQGLRAAGEDLTDARYASAVAWLRSSQNDDGGWGELPASYDDPALKGRGPSTASQTAWALLGLFAAGDFASPTVRRGVAYLVTTQLGDGGWYDEHWTGTGFPRVFYIRYHYYALYFPLQALAAYEEGLAGLAAAEIGDRVA